MDKIDKNILAVLQQNCEISNNDLAEKVGLSPSPCFRRVRLLEEKGYIKKKVALLNADKLGFKLTVIIMVGLNSHKPQLMREFEAQIKLLPEVVQCYLITGQSADYLLKIIVPDLNAYQLFLLERLTCLNGVDTVHSSFILRSISDTTTLPLDALI